MRSHTPSHTVHTQIHAGGRGVVRAARRGRAARYLEHKRRAVGGARRPLHRAAVHRPCRHDWASVCVCVFPMSSYFKIRHNFLIRLLEYLLTVVGLHLDYQKYILVLTWISKRRVYPFLNTGSTHSCPRCSTALASSSNTARRAGTGASAPTCFNRLHV